MGNLKAALTAIFSTNTYTSSSPNIGSKFVGIHESTGAASGIMNMSNLASVLGGISNIVSSKLSSMDDLDTNIPSAFIGSSYSPDDAPMAGSLLVTTFKLTSTVKWQFVTNGSLSSIKTRIYVGGAWLPWQTFQLIQ